MPQSSNTIPRERHDSTVSRLNATITNLRAKLKLSQENVKDKTQLGIRYKKDANTLRKQVGKLEKQVAKLGGSPLSGTPASACKIVS